ncbi:tRNA pseudouridine(13) synthase TruD [Dokdonella koreensis]|uniref:tRNA pseudouridine synthase D n=1 Tax=Dokdonella koreensis DS-123 TaxID=1300342 RepID=A0A160DTI5_9GAMM|nr:tRNA pseudouridine(13) synthase TruD [Dokdonella koreensis]ANB17687.1 tRNA pseudouridine synthase D [Dokdonella koreensis DS-123]
MESSPYAHGGPVLTGALRVEPADFVVEERLGFEPAGSGEHLFVHVEKTGANTDWVAQQLGAFAGVAPVGVGYAGLKDRHAVTRQWLSLHLPGRADPDWSALAIPGVRVLEAVRHDRKLKRGAHRGNRFRLRLREVGGDRDLAGARIAAIATHGVPNYFGEQRFGRDGDNLVLARQLFAGQRLPRHLRGFALSAARSVLFNRLLGRRVDAGNWDRAVPGEVWMLDGSHAIFGPLAFDATLAERLASGDIHPTGPLWGRGALRSEADVQALEASIAAADPALADGLAQAGLEQERRALRLRVADLEWSWEDATTLAVAFALESGAYATTVLRELADWRLAAGQSPEGAS